MSEKLTTKPGINPGRFNLTLLLIVLSFSLLMPASSTAAAPLDLTAEEREWLADNPEKLVLLFNIEFPPIEFSADGETFIGFGADVIEQIEELLEVSFIKVASDDWNAHLAALQSGECAIAPTIVRTTEREVYAFFTTPYATAPVVIITTKGVTDRLTLEDLAGWRIGVVSGYATEKYLQDQALLSRFEVIPVTNVTEGLELVSFGQVDAFVENLAVAAYYIDELGIPNLRVAGKTDYAFAWSIGVSRNYPLLYSSIQKALDAIPPGELAEIRKTWITLDADFGLAPETVRQLQLAGVFSALLLIGLTGISIILKKRLNRNVTELQASEEKFRSFVEYSSDIIYMLNEEGVFTYVSPSWKKLLGHEIHEVEGQFFTSFTYEKDLTKILEFQVEALQNRIQSKDIEYRVKHKNGSLRWHSSNGSILEKDDKIIYIGVARDITDRKTADEKIRFMSSHDRLTGLCNRYYLEDEMHKLGSNKKVPISMIMADLNGLKLVNDTYGHEKGDEMLRSAASIIKESCRENDIIARWGGDEFVVLLPWTSTEDALTVCKRITAYCREVFVGDVPLSIAMGVATGSGKSKNLIEILREAEDDMYKQKLTESRSMKNAVLQALLKALAEKSFETEIHTRRMQEIAQKIGSRLNLPDTELNRLNLLITLHDIGKINIAEDILTKKGSLTADEWAIIKTHGDQVGHKAAALPYIRRHPPGIGGVGRYTALSSTTTRLFPYFSWLSQPGI